MTRLAPRSSRANAPRHVAMSIPHWLGRLARHAAHPAASGSPQYRPSSVTRWYCGQIGW